MANKKQKKVQKTFAGMPMNWDWKNWYKNFWDAKNDEVFPPKRVGIGWDINFHALLRKIRILK